MKDGELALASLPQANGQVKLRPSILLRQFPPFGDWLVCGISTQLHQQASGFDEIIDAKDHDFPGSGLKTTSLKRNP